MGCVVAAALSPVGREEVPFLALESQHVFAHARQAI